MTSVGGGGRAQESNAISMKNACFQPVINAVCACVCVCVCVCVCMHVGRGGRRRITTHSVSRKEDMYHKTWPTQ